MHTYTCHIKQANATYSNITELYYLNRLQDKTGIQDFSD